MRAGQQTTDNISWELERLLLNVMGRFFLPTVTYAIF